MNYNHKNQQLPPIPPKNNKSSTTVGVIVILFGLFLLVKNLNFGGYLPHWLFGWEMIFIIIGLVIGVNSKFEKKSSIALISIGTIFLLRDLFGFSVMKVLFPIAAILVGIYIINRNRKIKEMPLPPPPPPTHPTDEFDWDRRVTDIPQMPTEDATDIGSDNHQDVSSEPTTASTDPKAEERQSYDNYYGSENILKVEAIFGSVNKIMLTKNFLGGNITTIFGSTEINLLQADIRQPVVIDTFQLFGSTKIIVPPHWFVSHDVNSVLGDNDDRRVIINHPFDEQRKLYITGTSVFGTLIIKNT